MQESESCYWTGFLRRSLFKNSKIARFVIQRQQQPLSVAVEKEMNVILSFSEESIFLFANNLRRWMLRFAVNDIFFCSEFFRRTFQCSSGSLQ
jgi:hypothetical protein